MVPISKSDDLIVNKAIDDFSLVQKNYAKKVLVFQILSSIECQLIGPW